LNLNKSVNKALFLESKDHHIASVSKITKNLFYAYKKIDELYTLKVDVKNLLSFKQSSSLDFIIIADLAVTLHSEFDLIFNEKFCSEKTTFIIHAMGDFFRKKELLIRLEDKLLGKKVILFSPSLAHQSLLKKCFANLNVSVLPFPIDLDKITSFNSKELIQFKVNYLKLKPEDYIFVYAGRISNQKKILELLMAFKEHLEVKPKAKLLLVGDLDNLENPTFYDQLPIPGNYFLEITKLIKENNLEESVKFLRNQSGTKLLKIIQCSDSFVSISLYHDEDFGFFPIESIYMGLPGQLTNWGGFKDLDFNKRTLEKIKIYFNKGNINSEQFKLVSKTPLSKTQIKINRRKIISNYSIDSISKKLSKEIYNSKDCRFKGFSLRFKSFTLSSLFTDEINHKEYSYFYKGFWK